MPDSTVPIAWIIPAYAGSTTSQLWSSPAAMDHPRIRGEHISDGSTARMRGGSSPHTRGAPVDLIQGLVELRIIPAYAGSTPAAPPRAAAGKDHPRIRGEHLHHHEIISCSRGSSPHTRGAPTRPSRCASAVRIIPAYAGSTTSTASILHWRRDHPRIRGEHAGGDLEPVPDSGSSPHTRGAPRMLSPGGVFSADHPRIRGEHQEALVGILGAAGSSPHTRGAHQSTFSCSDRTRIIPAYAGSTPGSAPSTAAWTDHPRIRGEHCPWRPGSRR